MRLRLPMGISTQLSFYTARGLHVLRNRQDHALLASPRATRPTETMISDPILQAFQQFQNGQYDEAGESCRLFLAGNPDHAQVNHLFGVIRFPQGRMDEALELVQRALSAPAATAEMHNNYRA